MSDPLPKPTGALERGEGDDALNRAILESSIDGVVGIDETGRILSFNPAAAKMFGYAESEVLGLKINMLMPEPHAALHDDYLQNYLRTGVRKIIGIGREVVGKRRDGSVFPMELAVAEAKLPGRRIFVGSVRDVTESKQLKNRALRAQRLESIGVLAGGIAHDLNNMLTPVVTALALLRKDRPEAQRRELLDTAQASLDRGIGVLRQLLTFAGGGPVRFAPTDARDLVREVGLLLKHLLPKSIELQFDLADDLWPTTGDANQLMQVLMNLCVNARDAMPNGGTLQISAANAPWTYTLETKYPRARPGPFVCIGVADSGSGIAPDVLERVFDPFFTTKPIGEGTGLGLSTALGIVRGHGGFMDVYSEVGVGTKFTAYLPAALDALAAPTTGAVVVAPQGAGELVLVVDDEAGIRTTSRLLLESAGYRVVCAEDGVRALEVFDVQRQSGEPVRAAVVDLMMPKRNGHDTVAELRRRDPHLPIVAVSGLTGTDRLASVKASGADVFLQKPFSEIDLLTHLAELLRARETQA